MNNRIRYNVDEIQRNIFYQFPKFLMQNQEFKGLSNDARVLYMVLRDRHDLSIKNKWIDENGDVFLICSRDEMQKLLNLSDKTITKAMNDLKKYRLIEEQRRGQGKSNLIYLLTLQTLENTQNRKIYDSGIGVITTLESENFRANDTYINENNISHVMSSLSHTENPDEKTDTTIDDDEINNTYDESLNKTTKKEESHENAAFPSDKHLTQLATTYEQQYTTYEEIIKSNIEYNWLMEKKPQYRDELDEVLFIMLDAILTDKPTIRVNNEDKPRGLVKSILLRLDCSMIEHAIDRFKDQRHKIVKIKPYILTCLYNSYMEINSHNKNLYEQNRDLGFS